MGALLRKSSKESTKSQKVEDKDDGNQPPANDGSPPDKKKKEAKKGNKKSNQSQSSSAIDESPADKKGKEGAKKGNKKSMQSQSSAAIDESPTDEERTEEAGRQKNADGHEMIPLGGNRYATVGHFKGKVVVDLREYYEDKGSGKLMPGKKGVALNVQQFEGLEKVMQELREKVDAASKKG